MNEVKLAVLDLYAGYPNEGMRCINEIIETFAKQHHVKINTKIFDVRDKEEIPDMSNDVFISTGGPGSPTESIGSKWEEVYFDLMVKILDHNANTSSENRKHVFLICHSFQIFCRHYGLGSLSKRKSTSFGVMPVHKTKYGAKDILLKNLAEPFWAVDSRDWQVTHPDHEKIEAMGGHVLAIEKYRPHIDLDRCIMTIRFNDEIFGTQFHPEADSVGMSMYLQTEEKKTNVIEAHGETKYYDMIEQLNDPDKIVLTYNTIIPSFLENAIESLILVRK